MTYMETLSEATNRLQKDGYNSEITPKEMAILNPKEWQIEHICRFEGKSNPSDNSILYAVAKKDGSRKSMVINAYGIYNDTDINKFIDNVKSVLI